MSQSNINLTPLISTKTGIFCHLLEFEDVKMIIDCGIDYDYDSSIYKSLTPIINSADCILITCFDIRHMGAIGLFPDVPVFCSIPTAVLGKIVLDNMKSQLIDKQSQSQNLNETPLKRQFKSSAKNNEHINVLNNINRFNPIQVKFSQPFKVKNIEINCYNAGCTIGNSVFKITKDLNNIVVCYNFNHRKENILDGLDLTAITEPDVFITNSLYVREKFRPIKTRNQELLDEIKCHLSSKEQTNKKVILTVSFPRLLELLSILNTDETLVLSSYAKLFVERAKSMIEWASTRAYDFLSNIKVSFGKISEINNYDTIIIVDELNGYGYLGSVLDKLDSKDIKIILLDRPTDQFYLSYLNIYDYYYIQKDKGKDELHSELSSSEDNQSSESDLGGWGDGKNTVFLVSCCPIRIKFPRKQNSLYGETVYFNFKKELNKASVSPEVISSNYEIVEKRLYKSTGIISELKVKSFDFDGISDFKSQNIIIECIDPKKVVIINDNDEFALFINSVLNLNQLVKKSCICDMKLPMNITETVRKYVVSDSIAELQFKEILDKKISKCKVIINDGILEPQEDPNKITIGIYNPTLAKKLFIENGFNVIENDNNLIVNDNTTISFIKDTIFIDSDDCDMLAKIREVIYKILVII